jgi:hypothetical protein
MNIKQEINLYIAQHGMWKSRLLNSLELKTSEFDPNVVKTDDNCAFGKWLYNSISSDLKNSKLYEEVRGTHARFHTETARILNLILSGKIDEARRSLQMDTEYASVSSKLTLLMMEWKKSV